jgi:hypothetical protein
MSFSTASISTASRGVRRSRVCRPLAIRVLPQPVAATIFVWRPHGVWRIRFAVSNPSMKWHAEVEQDPTVLDAGIGVSPPVLDPLEPGPKVPADQVAEWHCVRRYCLESKKFEHRRSPSNRLGWRTASATQGLPCQIRLPGSPAYCWSTSSGSGWLDARSRGLLVSGLSCRKIRKRCAPEGHPATSRS